MRVSLKRPVRHVPPITGGILHPHLRQILRGQLGPDLLALHGERGDEPPRRLEVPQKGARIGSACASHGLSLPRPVRQHAAGAQVNRDAEPERLAKRHHRIARRIEHRCHHRHSPAERNAHVLHADPRTADRLEGKRPGESHVPPPRHIHADLPSLRLVVLVLHQSGPLVHIVIDHNRPVRLRRRSLRGRPRGAVNHNIRSHHGSRQRQSCSFDPLSLRHSSNTHSTHVHAHTLSQW
mmetsp:Transcript_3842/g.10613  ORF Transcript_3842/g.10613 Transcript_3842/m.10613 type:complete len:237 (-) Transcript_3842:35-745(-)